MFWEEPGLVLIKSAVSKVFLERKRAQLVEILIVVTNDQCPYSQGLGDCD